jgi:hypothetical protein
MGSSNRSTLVSDAGFSEGKQAEGWQGAGNGSFAGRQEAERELNGSDHTVAVLAQAIQHEIIPRLMLAHRDFRLAEAKDVWVGSGLRDRGGNSGKRLGQQLEARLQWDVLPGNLTLESGFAWVDWSDFAERVGGAKMASQTHYFYLQSQLTF